VPVWTLLVAVPWIYVRLSLGLHELRIRDSESVPTFHRLAMVFDTPFGWAIASIGRSISPPSLRG
jgi:hypothetical protein